MQGKKKQFNFWLLVLNQTQQMPVPGSHLETWTPGCWWPNMSQGTQVCPAGLTRRPCCCLGTALPSADFHPSAHRQWGAGEASSYASVFWTAREWVVKGFPPAPPCSGWLNAAPMVISWLTIPELQDKNVTRDHRANKNTLLPIDTYGEKLLAPQAEYCKVLSPAFCWDLSPVLVLPEQCLLPSIIYCI